MRSAVIATKSYKWYQLADYGEENIHENMGGSSDGDDGDDSDDDSDIDISEDSDNQQHCL